MGPNLRLRHAGDDGVAVRLGDRPADTVDVGGHRLPVRDDLLVLTDVPGLPVGTNQPLLCGGLPVVRSRNAVLKPNPEIRVTADAAAAASAISNNSMQTS